MKKSITILLVILSGIMILDSLNAGQALFMFLLAGVIPGTDISLSSSTTLALFGGLAGFVLARVAMHLIAISTAKRSAVSSQLI